MKSLKIASYSPAEQYPQYPPVPIGSRPLYAVAAATAAATAAAASPKAKASCSTNSPTIPSSFLCPLTLSLMRDPVIDPEGYSYERTAIVEWLSRGVSRSPITRKPMRAGDLIPNRYLKDAIADYVTNKGTTFAGRRFSSQNSSDYSCSSSFSLSNGSVAITTPHGRSLSLNDDGICSFAHDCLTVTVTVPPHLEDVIHVTTTLPLPATNSPTLFKRMAILNHSTSRGGCLGYDPEHDDVTFSFTGHIGDENVEDYLRGVLEDFTAYALSLYKELKTVIDPEGGGKLGYSGHHSGLGMAEKAFASTRRENKYDNCYIYSSDNETENGDCSPKKPANLKAGKVPTSFKSIHFEDTDCLKKMAKRKSPSEVIDFYPSKENLINQNCLSSDDDQSHRSAKKRLTHNLQDKCQYRPSKIARTHNHQSHSGRSHREPTFDDCLKKVARKKKRAYTPGQSTCCNTGKVLKSIDKKCPEENKEKTDVEGDSMISSTTEQ